MTRSVPTTDEHVRRAGSPLAAQSGDAADALGRFVGETTFGDLSPEVVDRAKRSLLDLLGVAIAGSRSESADIFTRYVESQSAIQQASVVGRGRTTAYYAAMLNGTFAHATELSETFNRAVVHPGNVVFPAAFAAAERAATSGRELLTAAAVGYEVLVRAGLAAGGAKWMMGQGFHPPSALGALGAAASVAHILRLEPQPATHALGIAACTSPTTLSSAFRGATVKELFEGYSAAVGVMAADLAQAGVTAPDDWPSDWYHAAVREPSPELLTADLGQLWHIDTGGLRFKLRAVAAMATPTLDAIDELLASQPIEPTEILQVDVASAARVKIGAERRPRTLVAARASVPFLTAWALTHQRELTEDPHLIRTLTPESLDDARTLELAGRVILTVDPTIDAEFESGWPPKFAARVTVTTSGVSGPRTYQRYHDSFPRTNNLSWPDVIAKFGNVAGPLIGSAKVDRVADLVRNCEGIGDVSELATLVRR